MSETTSFDHEWDAPIDLGPSFVLGSTLATCTRCGVQKFSEPAGVTYALEHMDWGSTRHCPPCKPKEGDA